MARGKVYVVNSVWGDPVHAPVSETPDLPASSSISKVMLVWEEGEEMVLSPETAGETELVLVAHHKSPIQRMTVKDKAWFVHYSEGHPSVLDMEINLAGGGYAGLDFKPGSFKRAGIAGCMVCLQNKDGIIHHAQRPVPRSAVVGEVLHMDLVEVVNVRFLFAVDSASSYGLSVRTVGKSFESMVTSMLSVVHFFRALGWVVRLICWDGEGGPNRAAPTLLAHGVEFRSTSADQHFSRLAEISIRHVKNVMRCLFNAHEYNLPAGLGPRAFENAVKVRNRGRASNMAQGITRFSMVHGFQPRGDFIPPPFGTVVLYKVIQRSGGSDLDVRQGLAWVVDFEFSNRNLHIVPLEAEARTVKRVDFRIPPVTQELVRLLNTKAEKLGRATDVEMGAQVVHE